MSPCSMQDGRPGQCISIEQCPSLYSLYLDDEEVKDICDNSGFLPIVCCPLISDNTKVRNKSRKAGKISQRSK